MNDDEIIELALIISEGGEWSEYRLLKFAREIAAAEREACAQMCDAVYYHYIGPEYGEVRYGIAACAAAIRARGQE